VPIYGTGLAKKVFFPPQQITDIAPLALIIASSKRSILVLPHLLIFVYLADREKHALPLE
jgi:hypothetical protein